MSHLTMQDDIRPGPLSLREDECVLTHTLTLTLGGFGQPTKGPYAELHTPDQGVRLLAISNLKEGCRCFFMTHSRDVASNGMYASVAFSDRFALQHYDKGGGFTPPIT
jgi:hypothetical protein